MRIIVSILILARLLSGIAAAMPCYTVAAPEGAGATTEILKSVEQVFLAAHLCVTTLSLPHNRLIAMADTGDIDGVAMAIAPADIATAPLIAVPTAILQFTGMLYWPSGQPEPRGQAAVLGIVLGDAWAMREVSTRGTQFFAVRDNRQLLTMMGNGRLQGFLMPSETFQHFVRQGSMGMSFATHLVTELPVTLLMAPQDAALIPTLNSAVTSLKSAGTFDHIFAPYLAGFGERRRGTE